MKKLLLLSTAIFLLNFVYAQTKTDITGIWQAKLNGKIVTAKDMGTTAKPYADYFIFYVFAKEASYLVMSPNKNQITKSSISGLVKKQLAGEGTYKLHDSIPSIENENLRKDFEGQAPFKDKTVFIESSIQGEPISFYYEPAVKKIYGLNKTMKLELIKVGTF